jgi:hypothetical protein
VILAYSFYTLKEVQGYMMLAYGVTLPVEEPGGLRNALSGGGVVCTAEAWRRYFLRVPLLKEWSLSFGIVAMCFVIPGPVAGVTYLSL